MNVNNVHSCVHASCSERMDIAFQTRFSYERDDESDMHFSVIFLLLPMLRGYIIHYLSQPFISRTT